LVNYFELHTTNFMQITDRGADMQHAGPREWGTTTITGIATYKDEKNVMI